jgi:hypothetical protein
VHICLQQKQFYLYLNNKVICFSARNGQVAIFVGIDGVFRQNGCDEVHLPGLNPVDLVNWFVETTKTSDTRKCICEFEGETCFEKKYLLKTQTKMAKLLLPLKQG